jgi:hypothetical protein
MLPGGTGDAPSLQLSFLEDRIYVGGNLTVDVNSRENASHPITRPFTLSTKEKKQRSAL